MINTVDPARRIGQKKQVKVYRLIAEATMEEKILARARQKLVLDALLIKNGGGAAVIHADTTNDGEVDSEEVCISFVPYHAIYFN